MILNAGVALTKKYMTEENLELHMAANYFGHFLLTNLLMPLMIKSAAGRKKTGSSAKNDPGRIVALSSVGHWWGRVDLDNLNSERYYDVRFELVLTYQK